MSDYIYGSSLRAAKSKANYLFEGDFRRRPSQNLSGASRSLARGELLQQAAEQRQNREDTRRKEQSSIKIQSVWRGYRCREEMRINMRRVFDETIGNIITKPQLLGNDLDKIIHLFIQYYHSDKDRSRFDSLIDLMAKQQDVASFLNNNNSRILLFRITKLLIMGLNLLEKKGMASGPSYLSFLEQLTHPEIMLNKHQASVVWKALIHHKFYSIMRRLVDVSINDTTREQDGELASRLIELIRRSLDIEPVDEVFGSSSHVRKFFNEFLHGPISRPFDEVYFPKLLELNVTCLKPKYILSAFKDQKFSSVQMIQPKVPTTSFDMQQCTDAIWLCYSFIKSLHSKLEHLNNLEKVDYINILSALISPAEYITVNSLLQAAKEEDIEDNDEELYDYDPTTKTGHANSYNVEANHVIVRLIKLINDISHVSSLKTIIFNTDLQPRVQAAIIKLCNLMLNHEPFAIFNCRLLYTVAFSREFLRCLWKSILSSTSNSLYGPTTPIYLQLIRGNNVDHRSWDLILPRLRLFCSLYSYLLPTLDDEEIYTEGEESMYVDSSEGTQSSNSQQSKTQRHLNSSYFTDKELVGLSSTLRDTCVGLIEILYQENRQPNQPSNMGTTTFQDAETKLLSFEVKMTFKALVRLVCQLHAKDSRKQFCPDGHWICPSIAIPPNKAIDFQLVTSQQGRLLSQMTKRDETTERMIITASEIKTVLILQEIPFVISFHDRVQILHQFLRKEKRVYQTDAYHFGLPGSAIQVQIRRNYIYEDAFEKLSYENEPNMKLPLKVTLINAVGAEEAGIDGGGVSKEFLSELLKAGFDPMRGFFKSTKDQALYPNPSANVLFSNLTEGFGVHYEFLGRILGKAIYEKIMVELPLASFFLAKLLARKHSSDVDLHNLASLDPILYKNLVYLKNYKGDVADLNLDFTISNNELDEHEVVELKPGGSKIPVTRENKIEYVHLVADYRLNKQIRAQCAAFKRGLSQLIDLDWLRMFDPKELQILISGAPTMIDVYDWRRNTLYANGYADNSEAINAFWKVVDEFDEEHKRKLLKFATSCSFPPLLGFKDLVPQFTIAPTEDTRLPSASTCMNLLKLPECEDASTMRAKLLYAIESNSGFELS